MMKPNVTFLRKCLAGKVGPTFGYSVRHGGTYGFRGGEKTYERHLDAGYVGHATGASLGRPGRVPLTALGIAAVAEQTAPEEGTPDKNISAVGGLGIPIISRT